VVESGGPLLDAAGKRLLSDGRCTPGNLPVRAGIIFQLTGKPKVQPFDDNRLIIVVTGSSISGA